jgi:hypothetical protein
MISFRLDDEHNNKLQDLFTVLGISSKKNRITDLILNLIDKLSEIIPEYNQHKETVKGLNKSKRDLENEIEKLKDENNKLRENYKAVAPAGEIVKTLEPGRLFKPSTESTAAEGQWGNATFPPKMLGIPQTILTNQCPRGLRTNDINDWLIACQFCEAQSKKHFADCQTPMKRHYVQSKIR